MAKKYETLDSITVSDITGLGLKPADVAEQFYDKLTGIILNYGPATQLTWQKISRELLTPQLPFSLHQMMYYGCYRDAGLDPIAWIPDPESAALTNIGNLLERRGREFLGSKYKDPISSFSDFQEFSVANPEVFWKAFFDEIDVFFSVPPKCVLRDNPSCPGGQWLPESYMNPAKNCLNLSAKRRLDEIAVLWRDEGDEAMPVQKMTLPELRKEDAKVTMLGVVPSILRAWKSSNCTRGYDWSGIRCFATTGEASNVDECLWLMGRAQYKPVLEICGRTEIGGAFVSGSLLQPQSLSAFSTPAMGCSLIIIGGDGVPAPPNVGVIGELALGPLMLGASSTLLNADHYHVYFKGMPVWNGKVLRRHGDAFEFTSGGYYRAHGRADDTMNLGGIKVSSIEIERVCTEADNNILETAAIGVLPHGGGLESLVIVVIFKDLKQKSSAELNKLKASFNFALQNKLNPLFKVSRVVPLPSLSRTATNKVMRRLLRQQFAQTDQVSKL